MQYNLFMYCEGDPINGIDSNGYSCIRTRDIVDVLTFIQSFSVGISIGALAAAGTIAASGGCITIGSCGGGAIIGAACEITAVECVVVAGAASAVSVVSGSLAIALASDSNSSGGGGNKKPNQIHHFATNKSQTYTSQLQEVADKYGLDLDDEWNKELLPHQGRHPNDYHEYILNSMKQFDEVAQGDKEVFLQLVENLKSNIRNNPEMLYKDYWNGVK